MERHQPVLLEEVLRVLAPQTGERFCDLTAGYGGHAQALLNKVGEDGYGYLFDQDHDAVEYLKHRFADAPNAQIKQANFANIDYEAELEGKIDMFLLDLGVSSVQLDTPERGFSFNNEAPLDMRMNRHQARNASDIVNDASLDELTEILRNYGQVPQSRRIANAIVRARPIKTTTELAQVIEKTTPRRGKIHPATTTFQALRIAVNDELEAIRATLPKIAAAMPSGSRIAVISFHSLEDRIVKHFFRALCTDELNNFGQVETPAAFQPVTKKAIASDKSDTNPRARSARLRAIVKK